MTRPSADDKFTPLKVLQCSAAVGAEKGAALRFQTALTSFSISVSTELADRLVAELSSALDFVIITSDCEVWVEAVEDGVKEAIRFQHDVRDEAPMMPIARWSVPANSCKILACNDDEDGIRIELELLSTVTTHQQSSEQRLRLRLSRELGKQFAAQLGGCLGHILLDREADYWGIREEGRWTLMSRGGRNAQ